MKKALLFTLAIAMITGMSLQPARAAFIVHKPVDKTNDKPSDKDISSALYEFRHLSRKERKLRIKEAKSELKKFKAERRADDEPSTNQVLLVILAIILPPLAVYLHEGEINEKFWLDLVLTLLFFLPGVVYALIVVLKKDND